MSKHIWLKKAEGSMETLNPLTEEPEAVHDDQVETLRVRTHIRAGLGWDLGWGKSGTSSS